MNADSTAWTKRQASLGCTQRAVLFKRFPDWLNGLIHRRQVAFVLRSLPLGVQAVLDVGCGYGRVAEAVLRARPGAEIEGIESCTAFAEHFEKHFGRCHRLPVQQFRPARAYDAILIVTVLMYLTDHERTEVLRILWDCLAPGGRLICIEPAVEMVWRARRLLRKRDWADPTSGIRYFTKQEFTEVLTTPKDAALIGRRSVSLIPGLGLTVVHHCVAVEKRGGGSC
mgnify:CR=1 FL=1